MKIVILGAGGFIGTNLTIRLSQNNQIKLVECDKEYLKHYYNMGLYNVSYSIVDYEDPKQIEDVLNGQEILIDLVSTTIPTTSNINISEEIQSNINFSLMVFDLCIECGIKKILFVSSGGTVYGKNGKCPLSEITPTYPITSYGLQKLTIEKILYLYNYLYGIDYRIVRLANPYGPYQRPNGKLGAITNFTYKMLLNEEIEIYGDGSVIRDYVYIDDAVNAMINVLEHDNEFKTYNIGSGIGISINQITKQIGEVLNVEPKIVHLPGRRVDVPTNFLDITRYESLFGKLSSVSLDDGIKRTAEFLKRQYNI